MKNNWNHFRQTASAKMAVLVSTHFLADFFGCLLPGFLPVTLKYFGLQLSMGVVVITFMGIGANMMQIPAALLDRKIRSPRLLVLGLILASLILLIGLLPPTTPIWMLCLLMLAVGCGVALIHPHGLRGTQSITAIAPTVTTPTFMSGGFLGAAIAPWIGALLVGDSGMKGLLWLVIPSALVVLGIYQTHIRLAVETVEPSGKESGNAKTESPWSFRSLFLIALLMNIATVIFQMLLPTYLNTLGLPLSFGGFSSMLFGAGSTAGSLGLGYLIRKKNPAPFILAGFSLGIPVVFCYMLFAGTRAMCALSFFSGLLVSSAYPMLVALARTANEGKLGLGSRMAWIVGGTWGFANVIFMGIGQLTAFLPISNVMHLIWIFYLAALLTGILTLRKGKKTGKNLDISETRV